MANNLGIPEYTLAQLADTTSAPNQIGLSAGQRKSAYQPLVIRVTDHADNVALEEDDADLMALFCSKRQGEPWKKDANNIKHIIHSPTDGLTPATDVTVLYPNHDYTLYE